MFGNNLTIRINKIRGNEARRTDGGQGPADTRTDGDRKEEHTEEHSDGGALRRRRQQQTRQAGPWGGGSNDNIQGITGVKERQRG